MGGQDRSEYVALASAYIDNVFELTKRISNCDFGCFSPVEVDHTFCKVVVQSFVCVKQLEKSRAIDVNKSRPAIFKSFFQFEPRSERYIVIKEKNRGTQ